MVEPGRPDTDSAVDARTGATLTGRAPRLRFPRLDAWTTNQRRIAATGVIWSLPVLVTLLWLLTRGLLPARIPDFYGWGSAEFDSDTIRTSRVPLVMAVLTGPQLIAAMLVLWLPGWRKLTVKRRQAAMVLGYLVWQVPALAFKSMLVSYGASSAHPAESQLWEVWAAVGAASLAYPVLGLVLPPPAEPVTMSLVTPLYFGRQERVTWVGRAYNRGRARAVVVLLLAAGALMFVGVAWALCSLLLAAIFARRTVVNTLIDERGVHVSRGFPRWPTVTVAIDRITASSAQIVEWDFGDGMVWEGRERAGWHARSAAIRSGPTLGVSMTDGMLFVVSADRAHEAAEVLNALLLRRQQNHAAEHA